MSKELRVDGIFDIETRNWDEFTAGSLWTERDGVEVYTDEGDFARRLLEEKDAHIWAHNGGSFDTLWFLQWCEEHIENFQAQMFLTGSSVSTCKIDSGPVIRDSYRLIQQPLKEACTMFDGGVKKQALGLPCICRQKACEGYCRIGPKMSAAHRKRMVEYLEADILSLRDTLVSLRDYSMANGIELAGTTAGTTWKTAKNVLGLPNAEWDGGVYSKVRETFFGGRVEVGQTEAPHIWNYDRKQAYPASMCLPLPMGDIDELNGQSARRAFLKGRPGFYFATVNVPEMFAPPLPARGNNRVVFPWGRVEGYWSRDELAHAEERGAKIETVHTAIVWAREETILKSYMEKCFKLREAAPTKALKKWLKVLANSLYGGFAIKPEREECKFGDYTDDPEYERVGDAHSIWKRSVSSIPDRAHIHWASTLTAYARIELDSEIAHAGDSWCYSDTDSTKATRALTRNTGEGLGEWAFEGKATDWVCLAPKVYCFDNGGGKLTAKAKGISPDAAKHWRAIAARQPVNNDSGVLSLKVAAKSGDKLFTRKFSSRRLKDPNDWVGGRHRDGTRTRPPHMTEVEEIP